MNVIENSFLSSVNINCLDLPNNVLGTKLKQPPNGREAAMANQYNLNEIISQRRLYKTFSISEDTTGTIFDFTFDFDTARELLMIKNGDDYKLGTLLTHFKRVSFNIKFTLVVQGMKQFQGMLIVNTTSRTKKYEDIWSLTPKRLVASLCTLNRALIPLMEPSSTSFILPWTGNVNSFRLVKNLESYVKPEMQHYRFMISMFDELKLATGVVGNPVIQIYWSLDDFKHGVYGLEGGSIS